MPANADIDVSCSRKSTRRPGVSGSRENAWLVDQTNTSRDGSRYGSGLGGTQRMTLKMAVFAPMPSARVRTAVAVNPGLLHNARTAYHESCRKSLHMLARLCSLYHCSSICRHVAAT